MFPPADRILYLFADYCLCYIYRFDSIELGEETVSCNNYNSPVGYPIQSNHSSISPQQNSLDNHRCTCCNMVYFSVIFLYSIKDNTTSKVKVMKKEIIYYIITIIALIVIVPFELLFFWLPSLFKAFLRYISDKDKGSYTFTDYLDDVRHESKSFNRHWQKMASKGIYVD